MPKVTGRRRGEGFAPYWTTRDGETARLYLGHVTDVLARLHERSVHCVVTSPPYWGLRDYKAGPGELGREPTPQEYVDRMVVVLRGVRRVLRDDGTCWLNLGDSYGGGPPGGSSNKQESNRGSFGATRGNGGLPEGNLVGVPWRVALALQADGWVLRQDIIWHKPAPMPESVRNRCTKSHEYVFLLTKGMRYYYDAVAIKEKGGGHKTGGAMNYRATDNGDGRVYGSQNTEDSYQFSNKRSVWTVNSSGYPGAHFATFPPKLIEPMILAGTSEHGCCAACGAPWRRVTEESTVFRERPNAHVKYADQGPNGQPDQRKAGVDVRAVGWEPACECGSGVVPCTVLDPFVGSGTTVAVAVGLGRRGWGVDLSERYLRLNAVPRVEGALLRRPALAGQVVRDVGPTGGGRVVGSVRGGGVGGVDGF